jgi:hypothetical protein
MKQLIVLSFLFDCITVNGQDSSRIHYDTVVIQPHPPHSKHTYKTFAYNVWYYPETKTWTDRKGKKLLRGRLEGADVYKIEKL